MKFQRLLSKIRGKYIISDNFFRKLYRFYIIKKVKLTNNNNFNQIKPFSSSNF